jgi:3'(2'), 5'-bisphosphate nucleotidase
MTSFSTTVPASDDIAVLAVMEDLALVAGERIMEVFRRGVVAERKADASPVTEADRAAERIILDGLRTHFPDIPVVAEEECAEGRAPTMLGKEFFLVDPLDGTKEFIQRSGDFTVNIALIRSGLPALGVVYAPARNRLYAGDVGASAAWRSEAAPARAGNRAADEADGAGTDRRVPIHVRVPPAHGLTAVASRSHRTAETDAYLARYPVAELVSVGSSLKFCLVAAGEADLYPRLGPTMEWDTAAGHAVLAAAGGSVIAPDGQALRYGKPGFANSWFVASGAVAAHPPEG